MTTRNDYDLMTTRRKRHGHGTEMGVVYNVRSERWRVQVEAGVPCLIAIAMAQRFVTVRRAEQWNPFTL